MGQEPQPQPSDAELVARARAGDARAAGALIDRHIGLVKSIVRKLGPHPAGTDREDLVQLGRIALWKLATETGPAAWKPDDAGTGIGPYAHQYVLWAVLKGLRSERRPRPRSETDLPDDGDRERPLDKMACKPVSADGPLLTGTEAAVVEGVLSGEPRDALAKRLGMTPGVVRRVFLSALRTVRESAE